jgi:hypothetical protein
MSRRMELAFPDAEVRLQARLHDEDAPRTSEVVWRLLEQSFEATLNNAYPWLPELWFWIPPVPELPFENATVFARAGEIVLYHYDQPGGNYTSPDGRVMAFDLGIYYTQGHSNLPACGWMSANLVATIEDLEALKPVVARAFYEKTQRIVVSRA